MREVTVKVDREHVGAMRAVVYSQLDTLAQEFSPLASDAWSALDQGEQDYHAAGDARRLLQRMNDLGAILDELRWRDWIGDDSHPEAIEITADQGLLLKLFGHAKFGAEEAIADFENVRVTNELGHRRAADLQVACGRSGLGQLAAV